MPAYYNEIDPYAAQWLRNLIAAGHIAPGEVDERSILDVRPDDLKGFEQCHFFAGIGGWSYALRLAGFGDDRPVWTGSCPCQPFSLAGKQKGFDDERHLWPVWRGLIAERRPAKVFGEQVASATEWLGLVRGDLEALGYAVGAMPIQAASAGADHLRDRYWFVADGQGERSRAGLRESRSIEHRNGIAGGCGAVELADADDARSQRRRLLPERASERIAGADGLADANGERGQVDQDAGGRADGSGARSIPGLGGARNGDVSDSTREQAGTAGQPRQRERLEWVIGADGKARRVKPGIRLLAHGVPARVGKLRGFGNAIDPRPAAAFIAAAM